MTILFVFTCMMKNVGDQRTKSLVTSFGPFFDRSFKYVLTMEYRVFQYARNTSISEQFESILLTFLLRISILLI